MHRAGTWWRPFSELAPCCTSSLKKSRWSKCSSPKLRHFAAGAGRNAIAKSQNKLDNNLSHGKSCCNKSTGNIAAPRYNEIGVQQLSHQIYSQVFPGRARPASRDIVQLSKDHLSRHDLLGKNQDETPPIAVDLPELRGKTLDEHFDRLGRGSSEPYLSFAHEYARADLPTTPRRWARKSGWTKYNEDGKFETIAAPQEEMLTFDVEVLYKQSPFAVMACAASPTAWYAWLSPWLLGESENDQHLIPLGDATNPRIIIGHNVGYDRARVAEEYGMQQTKNFFIDTMSLHVAVNGMTSRQRPTWMKHMKNRDLRDRVADETNSHELANVLENKLLTEEEEELWVERSSVNSLRDVAKFHCGVTIDKTQRDAFGELDRAGIRDKLNELLDYCAGDVAITHQVYKKILPGFVEVCPHPVSFAALRHISSVILPVNKTWKEYINNAEATYQKLLQGVGERLANLCNNALELKGDLQKCSNDPWLRQLDWSGQDVKMVKGKKKGDPPRPAARQKLPGMPKWYKALFPTAKSELSLTVRTRIAPILLRLAWNGNPLVWSDKHGWTFRVKKSDASAYKDTPVVQCDMSEETNTDLRDDRAHTYFKLPHKDGPAARCANPLAKGYLQYFENGVLSSEFSYAKEALEMNASCSYWISARDRIMSQMVVYQGEAEGMKPISSVFIGSAEERQGFILPQLIPMGTVTRRAVENTWLTASNAKKNRVGSELKSMVKAPSGYHFVGADVDSEELWIASLVGDAQFGLHGGNALGFMTLEGTKSAGTDLHSKTASILGISRNDAKVFNYGRIYGAGLKFAGTLLRQFNPSLSEKQTEQIAQRLYRETKGARVSRRAVLGSPFWRGGSESLVFNTLEAFAEQERPRTPALGAGITEALMRQYISKGGFMTSRINWAIQSSGVDYLHLLIVSMDYLIKQFNLDARLAITVHDEIRYLVKSEDRYRAAMALQVSNLWTRAMFAQQVGIDDLPQCCAFFSAIDIDHVLRKEVDIDCVTPSHPHKIQPGESLDILALLEKGEESRLDPNTNPHEKMPIDEWTYEYRRPVMADMISEVPSQNDLLRLKAQIAGSDQEFKAVIGEIAEVKRKEAAGRSHPADTKSAGPRKRPKAIAAEDGKSRKAASMVDKSAAVQEQQVDSGDSGIVLGELANVFNKDGWKRRLNSVFMEKEKVKEVLKVV